MQSVDKRIYKICAPMVRYSRLEFRSLVRKYGVDLCFTPMIMTDSFCQSDKARIIEFTTNHDDTPLIAQFAANNVHEYLSSAEMVYPYVDGIDLNCGCPQRWAMSASYGSALLNQPELINDLTSTIRRNFPNSFSVSVKIRKQKPLSKTINLCRQLEKCGVSFITVHGRTASQKTSERANMECLKEIKQSLQIPLIANGDCKSLSDADAIYDMVHCDGVMAARGILSNPTLFSGKYATTPIECIQDWINVAHAANENIIFQNFHHHLSFMMEKMLRRRDRVEFNGFTRKQQVFDYLADKFDITPKSVNVADNLQCTYDDTKYRDRVKQLQIEQMDKTILYDSNSSKGRFFLEKMADNKSCDQCDSDLDFMDSSLFDELD